jgi:hypothetical protein
MFTVELLKKSIVLKSNEHSVKYRSMQNGKVNLLSSGKTENFSKTILKLTRVRHPQQRIVKKWGKNIFC